ncbi:MAG: DUF4292 domain-containing protein [Deltaproteobacteria bacterium]|nr:DUF4292 domain-containing protein [Deltaproteobacteria bacterium]
MPHSARPGPAGTAPFVRTTASDMAPSEQPAAGTAPSALPGPAGTAPFAAARLKAALCMALLAFAGCSVVGMDPTRAASENRTATDLAQALWADAEDLPTFAMRGDATYRSDNSSNFFRFELVCQRPGSFLFTAFDPFGSPVFRIATAGGKLSAIDYSGKAFYSGSVSGEALGLILPLPLSPEELLAVLSGSLPFRPALAEAEAQFPEGVGDAVMLLRPEAGVQAVRVQVVGDAPWTDAAGKMIRRVSTGTANSPDFQVTYGSWENYPRDDRGGAQRLFPRSVSAAWRQSGDHSLDVTYREVSLGFVPPAGVFGLERPSGYSSQAL